MSSSNPTDQFIKKRRRLLKSKSGIEDNNRRVRLQNFEKSMKREFGPNVEVSPDGIATRGGETVGNLDDFLKGGGQLMGTPRDQRSKLAIEKEKQEEADKNFDFETAASALDTGSNRSETTITDFKPSKEESMKSTMKEIENIMAAPESLDDVLKKSLTGTDEASAGATNSTMADQLRETSGRLEQLKILQGASEADVAGMIKANPTRIQQGLLDSGFTPERLAKLKIKNAKFQLKKRGK